MLISQNWLTSLIRSANPGWGVGAPELDAGFVRVGFETEGYSALPEITGPLVLGRVAAIEELAGFKKPIRYCQVDVGAANGTGEPQNIICGARNFREGSLVVVSLPGTVLPGGFEISARKTYGKVSEGMICSAAELGLTDKQNAGILTLPEGVGEPGEDARPVLGLADTVFDVNITPDRGYALSARGLSREICSAFNLTFADVAEDPAVAGHDVSAVPAPTGQEVLPVTVEPATKAARFGLRRVTGVDPAAESPYWLQRELMLCGARPVNTPTDVTNYVMFLLGQPMHAFDGEQISGGLTVRCAQEGEALTTLDDVSRTLYDGDVVICDDAGIQSLAGVMGGSSSEISETTTDVVFEAACWDPITTARTSRRHKLSSEASRRFERGVDPALVDAALDLACALLQEIAGGTISAERTLVRETPAMPTITMAAGFPGEVAGVDYPAETVVRRLEEVGCRVAEAGQGSLSVTPPTWRSDLTMPVELVEEVLRLEGLEDIPSILPKPTGGRGLSPAQRRRRAVGHALAYGGYTEIIPTPFMAAEVLDTWQLAADDPRRRTVSVRNPLEPDHAVLATTLLPAMLEALGRNVARGQADVSLYGVQQVSFSRGGLSPMPDVSARPSEAEIAELAESLPEQPLHVAVVGTGVTVPAGPWGEARAYTYEDAVEAAHVVARTCGVDLRVETGAELPWHPGRCAALVVDGRTVGHAGELHPQVLQRMKLPLRTCAMELDLSAVPLVDSLPAPVLSSFPALRQDVALVVSEDVEAARVAEVLAANAGDLLEGVSLFDVYRNEAQLGAGRKSLAFGLVFRAPDRTLTDAEVNEVREATTSAAAEAFGAEVRA